MPTASDMARLGNTLISGHRQRNAAIAAMRVETRQFVGHLRDQDVARRGAVQEHAAETGRFMDQLHDQTRARKRDVRRHAAETGRFLGQLHNESRARKRDVRRHAAETAGFVRYLHGVTRDRKHEVAQLLAQAREFMAGLTTITRQVRAEWRQRAAINSTRRQAARTGRGAAARSASSVGAMETEAEWETEGSILAYIAEHPGTRLVEIEEALEINRLEAAQGVRALLDQGRIRRDEETRQYFPA